MQRVKRRIFSGVVCEQEVYTVSDRANIKKAEPRPRFKDDEERAQHRIGISKRKHQRLVNENFSPLSLYSTLTFDDDSEVHTFSEARRIRDNYFRRLQRACPDAKIIIYMGRGKSTNRIHFHMISDGIPEETISGKWNDGSVIHIRHLREHNYYNGVDYGQDYTGLADLSFGNAITFTANRLQYASNQTKLNISTQLFDRGLLNRNGVMDVWNMAHVEGGEKYYIRKEYAEVSELGKEVTPNAKKDGSGVQNNDPAAIDPDGDGEAN